MCFIRYQSTTNFVKHTPLLIVFPTLFSVFRNLDETLSLMFDRLHLHVQMSCLFLIMWSTFCTSTPPCAFLCQAVRVILCNVLLISNYTCQVSSYPDTLWACLVIFTHLCMSCDLYSFMYVTPTLLPHLCHVMLPSQCPCTCMSRKLSPNMGGNIFMTSPKEAVIHNLVLG